MPTSHALTGIATTTHRSGGRNGKSLSQPLYIERLNNLFGSRHCGRFMKLYRWFHSKRCLRCGREEKWLGNSRLICTRCDYYYNYRVAVGAFGYHKPFRILVEVKEAACE